MVLYAQKELNNFFVELTNVCIKGGKAYYFEEIVKGIGSLTLEKGGIPMRKNMSLCYDKYCLEVFKVGTFCSSLGHGLKEMTFIF